MDFSAIIKQIIGLGLPILGSALGGPLGGSVATIIAKSLGASDATPAAIGSALQTTPNDIAIQKLKSAEAEYLAAVNAESTIAQTQVIQIAETIRAELAAGAQIGGWVGALVQFLQVSWRPVLAYETIAECIAGAVLLFHEAWTGDFSTMTAMSQFQTFLSWYISLKFGLLGVYSVGRSVEKVRGTEDVPSAAAFDKIIEAVKAKLLPAKK